MQAKQNDAAATPRLGRYRIDTDASALAFSSRHLFGLMPVHGTFRVRSGTVEIAEPLTESTIQVDIDAASFHTGDARRDKDVRSAHFLDTARYPVMAFVSASADATGVTGVLTVCGITRPVALSIQDSEVAPDSFTVRATTRIDRTEFGVTRARGMAGRHLDLTLKIKCVHV
ncbi:YceI family protein [Streptomyces sp. WMMB303]|uniref:YceI family protein n=1 Tax=Streptomyces sp. WMMB303 TaxID=3034154 RepID=UPI0023ED0F95|nr:YceI family protein [Streptomyces sp. WMMB303]MDF4252542.1 YceI family protein [Streptomyces sp. WMMB303]